MSSALLKKQWFSLAQMHHVATKWYAKARCNTPIGSEKRPAALKIQRGDTKLLREKLPTNEGRLRWAKNSRCNVKKSCLGVHREKNKRARGGGGLFLQTISSGKKPRTGTMVLVRGFFPEHILEQFDEPMARSAPYARRHARAPFFSVFFLRLIYQYI